VATYNELFSTWLLAGLFALAWTMALLLAFVSAATKSFSANIPATDIRQPARLVFQHILAAKARLGGEKWALWAAFFVPMAVVTHLRMTTVFGTLACEATWGWLRATG
jgi:hypothetical protein